MSLKTYITEAGLTVQRLKHVQWSVFITPKQRLKLAKQARRLHIIHNQTSHIIRLKQNQEGKTQTMPVLQQRKMKWQQRHQTRQSVRAENVGKVKSNNNQGSIQHREKTLSIHNPQHSISKFYKERELVLPMVEQAEYLILGNWLKREQINQETLNKRFGYYQTNWPNRRENSEIKSAISIGELSGS